MTTLQEAIAIVKKAHPNEYIHAVNEHRDVFQFILLDNGTKMDKYTFVWNTPLVSKQTGKLDDTAYLWDERCSGDYKQYSKDDLEGL